MFELTSFDFRDVVTAQTVVIVPFGALEAHGPHLPLGSDTIQAEASARAVAERTGALVAPTVAYGVCPTFAPFPGTISLSYDTLRSVTREILASLARHGVRRVVLLSGHGSQAQMEALREAALEAVEAHGMRIFVVCDFEIARLSPQGSEPDLGGHAGALETSRLLALRGELVRGTPRVRYRPPPPGLVAPDPELYFPDGVRGDPTKASMELGQRLQEAVIQALVELVEALKKEGP